MSALNNTRLEVKNLGFRAQGLGVLGFGGLGFRVFGVQGLGFLGFRALTL